MPHSLFLGSGVVHARLRHFDLSHGNYEMPTPGSQEEAIKYRPSLAAIRACMNYSIVELAVALFTFALFVNSAILIVAGASLYHTGATDADIFGIYRLLQQMVGKGAGTVFALALLLSGSSAGIICTIAGQMVSEGMLNWSIRPWLRRLLTRLISITPSIIIAGAVGKQGLNAALNASQVVLSVILPFVSAPLIYFTCRNRYMTVLSNVAPSHGEAHEVEGVPMRNHWVVSALGGLIWTVIAIMNVALLVLIGLGKA